MRHYRLLALAFLITTGCASTASATRPANVAFQPPGYVRGDKDTKADRVIIFIHGIFGDGSATWTNRNGAYFPALLRDDPTFDGVDIWVHDFPSPKRGHTYNIDELAAHLRKHLNEDNVVANHREIIFVAHSMGGIVTRAYLLQHRELTPERVSMLYLFSTPSTGSEVANLARIFSNSPQLVDLRPMTTEDAGVLGVYQNQWLSSPLRGVPTYCAYELLPTKGVQIVQRTSATQLCTMRLDPINRDHGDIVKPANNNTDESYRAFRDAYRDRFDRSQGTNLTPAWNLRRHERALVEARNVTQSPFCENECWSDHIIVAPGDVVNFAVSYTNDSFITARDSRVRLAVPQTPIFLMLPLNATLSASNVPSIHGQVALVTQAPALLVPTSAWRQTDDSDDGQPLPYTQTPASVLTDGLRVGDIGPTQSGRVIIQFRCEPVTIAMNGDGEAERDLIATLKSKSSEEQLQSLLNPSFAGHVEEFLWANRWVSEVHDVHDDGSVSMLLSHYNNTDTVLHDVRARVSILSASPGAASIQVVLQHSAAELRTDTIDVRFRPGTTQQLSLGHAFRAPKNTFQLLALVSLAMKGAEDVAVDELALPIVGPGEILLGDLPPQTGIAADVELVMATRVRSFGPAPSTKPVLRTTLNHNTKHPLLQASKERHADEWKTHVVGLRRGDPVAFTFYFKNTGRAIARDVRLRLKLTHDERGISADGTMTAENAEAVTGTAHIAFAQPGAITLFYDRTEIYRHASVAGRLIDTRNSADAIPLGDLDPGEWGLVKMMYVTAPDAQEIECTNTAAIAGKRIEFSIAINNPRHDAVRDVTLRVHLDYHPRNIRSTIALFANESPLGEHTYQANTLGDGVELRYRDAQVYTTSVGRHVDARKATESAIAIGDLPADGQMFVRLTYDVMAKSSEGCSGIVACPGVECVASDLCQF